MKIVSTENFIELINLFESYILHHTHINNLENEILQHLNELRESVE